MSSSVTRDVAHIERFNGTNFPQWKYGVFLLLEEHDLLSIVEVLHLTIYTRIQLYLTLYSVYIKRARRRSQMKL